MSSIKTGNKDEQSNYEYDSGKKRKTAQESSWKN